MSRNYLSNEDRIACKNKCKTMTVLAKREKERFEVVARNFNLEQNRNIDCSGSRIPLRIVVIGKIGVGKSATGNTILGKEVFQDGATSEPVTTRSVLKSNYVNGRKISVLDTPGLQSLSQPSETTLQEFAKIMETFRDGVHVFVHVMNLASPRFTDEDRESLETFEKMFGGMMKKHRLLVYTHAECELMHALDLQQFCDQQIRENQYMTTLLRECKPNVVAVNNKCRIPMEKKRNQDDILALIDNIVKQNKESVYINEMFTNAAQERKKWVDELAQEGYDITVIEAAEAVFCEDPELSGISLSDKVRDELRREIERHKSVVFEITLKDSRKRKLECEEVKEKEDALERGIVEDQIEAIKEKHNGYFENIKRFISTFWNKIFKADNDIPIS